MPRVGDDAECTHTSHGGNGHVSRESRRSNRSIVRVSGDSSKLHEMNPRNSRATPHKRGQCAKHEHRPIQSEGSARTASTAPPHPKKIKTLKRST